MAVTGFFSNGILSLIADANDNDLTVSRNAAGTILVNSGTVAISRGTPTVANTSLIQVFGLGGNDFVTLDETNGALPRAHALGGTGDAVPTGTWRADMPFGEGGADFFLERGQRHVDRARRQRPEVRRKRRRPHDLEPGGVGDSMESGSDLVGRWAAARGG